MYGENVNLSLLLKTANTQSNTGKQLNLAQDTHVPRITTCVCFLGWYFPKAKSILHP